MDEIYILQNCNEWKEHSSANIEVVSTDYNMLLAVIYQKILSGDMQYKYDSPQESIAAFKEDVQGGTFDDGLLQYGMIKSFDNVRLEMPVSLAEHSGIDAVYTTLFGEKEPTMTVEDVMAILDLKNTGYYVSEVEIRSNTNYCYGFVPMVDDINALQYSDAFKNFLSLGNTGTINLSAHHYAVGNCNVIKAITDEQAEMLCEYLVELQEITFFDDKGNFFHSFDESEYLDNEFER